MKDNTINKDTPSSTGLLIYISTAKVLLLICDNIDPPIFYMLEEFHISSLKLDLNRCSTFYILLNSYFQHALRNSLLYFRIQPQLWGSHISTSHCLFAT